MSQKGQRGNSLDATERRQHLRHRAESLAYVDIGSDNGGIILNISEGGLAVQAMGVLPPVPVINLRLQLPKSTKRLATSGRIAWTSGSKKEAGVEFVDLPEEARLRIKNWLSSETPPQPLPPPLQPAAAPLPSELPSPHVPVPAESIPKRASG
jgi:hypothetical protein